MSEPVALRPARPWPSGEVHEAPVAVEEPLEIRVEGEPLAVVLRTPGDDLDLAAGFLLTEGVIEAWDDLTALAMLGGGDASNTVDCRLAAGVPAHRAALDRAQRAMYATSSCGICGKASIDRLRLRAPPLVGLRLSPAEAARCGLSLRDHQPGHALSGGLHAAALVSADGQVTLAREDVGRHNAVDKVVGARLRRGAVPIGDQALVVSSRAGFEIIQKAWMAGISTVVALGAPTTLAIDLAQEADLTLYGFARGDRATRYA